MKKIYSLLVTLLACNSFAQSILTTSFAGEMPNSIEVVNNNLYVSTFATQSVYRLDLDNISSKTLVANFPTPVWKISYDSSNNDFYVNNLSALNVIDLDESLPISPTIITDVLDGNGLEVNDNLVYVADGKNLLTYNTSEGPGSYRLLYSETDGEIYNPRFYDGEIYFQVFSALNLSTNGIYKISPAASTISKELVTLTGEGVLQSSLIVNDFLYLGLEIPNSILRINLLDTFPTDTDIVLQDLGSGVIGLANKGNTIYYTLGDQLIYSLVDSVLGNENKTLEPPSLYPNPSSEFITVSGIKSDFHFKIFSINGQLNMEGKSLNRINLPSLQKGLYILEVKNENGLHNMKFIKN